MEVVIKLLSRKRTDGSDGRLASLAAASLAAASGPPTAELSRTGARKVIEEAIYETGSITMKNMRGPHYHAMSNLYEYASNVRALLAQLRGRAWWNVRFVERFLHPDELVLLEAAWPARS